MQYLISEAEMEQLKKFYKEELDKTKTLAKRVGYALKRKYKNECIYDETKPIRYCSSCVLFEVGEQVSKYHSGFTSEFDVIDLLCGSDKHFGK